MYKLRRQTLIITLLTFFILGIAIDSSTTQLPQIILENFQVIFFVNVSQLFSKMFVGR